MSRLAPLRSLLNHLTTGEPLPERDRARLIEGLPRILAGEADLEEALGLRGPSATSRTARTIAILEYRDWLLREAAAEFFPGLPANQQARELHRRWTHYAASGWKRGERALDRLPPHREGTLEARFWAIMRARDFVPGQRTIREALATSTAYSLPAPWPRLD